MSTKKEGRWKTSSFKREAWSEEEDRIIIDCHQRLGSKWSIIARSLPGRSDNSIKNRWNSTMRRVARQLKQQESDAPPAKKRRRKPTQNDILYQYCADIIRENPSVVSLPGKTTASKRTSRGRKTKSEAVAKAAPKRPRRTRRPRSPSPSPPRSPSPAPSSSTTRRIPARLRSKPPAKRRKQSPLTTSSDEESPSLLVPTSKHTKLTRKLWKQSRPTGDIEPLLSLMETKIVIAPAAPADVSEPRGAIIGEATKMVTDPFPAPAPVATATTNTGTTQQRGPSKAGMDLPKLFPDVKPRLSVKIRGARQPNLTTECLPSPVVALSSPTRNFEEFLVSLSPHNDKNPIATPRVSVSQPASAFALTPSTSSSPSPPPSTVSPDPLTDLATDSVDIDTLQPLLDTIQPFPKKKNRKFSFDVNHRRARKLTPREVAFPLPSPNLKDDISPIIIIPTTQSPPTPSAYFV